jgi:hypothetical protein
MLLDRKNFILEITTFISAWYSLILIELLLSDIECNYFFKRFTDLYEIINKIHKTEGKILILINFFVSFRSNELNTMIALTL